MKGRGAFGGGGGAVGRHNEGGSDSAYNHLKVQERGMRSLGRGRLDREILGGWVKGR